MRVRARPNRYIRRREADAHSALNGRTVALTGTPRGLVAERQNPAAGRVGLKRDIGGRGGIRTHGPREGTPVFKTGAINRSATLPSLNQQLKPIFSNGYRNCRGRSARARMLPKIEPRGVQPRLRSSRNACACAACPRAGAATTCLVRLRWVQRAGGGPCP